MKKEQSFLSIIGGMLERNYFLVNFQQRILLVYNGIRSELMMPTTSIFRYIK